MSESERPMNWRLRAARQELGLSQAGCARKLESYARDEGHADFRCAPGKLRRWEKGVQPHAYAHPVLGGFFGRTPAELGIGAAAWACTSDGASATVSLSHPVPADQEVDEVKRRQLAAGAAALAGLPVLEQLCAPLTHIPKQVSQREIDRVHDAADTFATIGDVRGGAFARPAIISELEWSADLLRQSCPLTLRAGLFSAVGHLAMEGGYAMFDARDHVNASRAHRFGVACAEEAQDWSLRGQLLAVMARHASQLDDPDQALTYVELAMVRADRLGGAELARLHAARAKALGQLGRAQEAVRAIVDSDEAFARRDAANTPSWMSFYNQAMQLTDTGSALCALEMHGHPTDAAARLARAAAEHSDAHARARTISQARLAHLTMLTGDPREAAAIGNAAVDLAGPIRSARIEASLNELAAAAQVHRSIPEVTHLRRRILPT